MSSVVHNLTKICGWTVALRYKRGLLHHPADGAPSRREPKAGGASPSPTGTPHPSAYGCHLLTPEKAWGNGQFWGESEAVVIVGEAISLPIAKMDSTDFGRMVSSPYGCEKTRARGTDEDGSPRTPVPTGVERRARVAWRYKRGLLHRPTDGAPSRREP